MQNELEKALENKFFCPSRFAQEIESLVQKTEGMTYIDAVVHFCEQNSIDLESVPKLISKPLKEKIKYEATELNFLKAIFPCQIAPLIPKKGQKKSGKILPLLLFFHDAF